MATELGDGDVALPMFPLGSVLLPGAMLPLRLFEPRYLVFIDDVMRGDKRFGVVLIERGSEVGGGDVRSPIGCVATLRRSARHLDGSWTIVAEGGERFEVVSWRPDDPYPHAIVHSYSDDASSDDSDDDLVDIRWIELDDAFRGLEALLATSANRAHDPIPMSSDPGVATFEIANALPMTPYDRYKILASRSAEERRVLLLDTIAVVTTLVSDP